MKPAVVAISLAFLSVRGACAHRLDEYLQATTIALGKDRVEGKIRLTPGVAVLSFVLKSIDTDGDGVISDFEQRAYAERVLQDLSLNAEGRRVPLQLVSTKFPSMQQMRDGLGEIQLAFTGNLIGHGSDRTLVFENHHQNRISAYLVNCLVPRDPAIQVTGQNRSYDQSLYQLDYHLQGALAWWPSGSAWAGLIGALLLVRLVALWWRQRFRANLNNILNVQPSAFGNCSVKIEPRPNSLSAVKVAPCSSAICCAIASPRPVPPASLERTLSARQKRSNT